MCIRDRSPDAGPPCAGRARRTTWSSRAGPPILGDLRSPKHRPDEFWYPVQRQRLPEIAARASASVGSGLSCRYAVMVVRKPGVQNPHCSPWHSMKACCTGLIVVAPVPSANRASPSTVVISWSWAVTANMRQERIGVPSIRTVQAPQTPCSQPTWVPVRRRSCRRKSDRSLRAGADAVCITPLTCSVISSNGSASVCVISLCVNSLMGSDHRCLGSGGGARAGHGLGGRLGENAGGEDADEHPAILRAGMDVGIRVGVLAGQLGCRCPVAVLG